MYNSVIAKTLAMGDPNGLEAIPRDLLKSRAALSRLAVACIRCSVALLLLVLL